MNASRRFGSYWSGLSPRRKLVVVAGVVLAALVLLAALNYVRDQDGLSLVDPANPNRSYLAVFLLVALDAVVPIFPGETTLNTASTAAAAGRLELAPIIVMGALGAIVGDSALFWIARLSSRRVEPTLERARGNEKVMMALDIMDSSAPLLIVGGRYVMGMRFFVNATMGLSGIAYVRFLTWSIVAGVLWSTYTCILAYKVATTFAGFPLASVIISSLVTTVVLVVVLFVVRKRRRSASDPDAAQPPTQ